MSATSAGQVVVALNGDTADEAATEHAYEALHSHGICCCTPT